jgi:hypothetical protein
LEPSLHKAAINEIAIAEATNQGGIVERFTAGQLRENEINSR